MKILKFVLPAIFVIGCGDPIHLEKRLDKESKKNSELSVRNSNLETENGFLKQALGNIKIQDSVITTYFQQGVIPDGNGGTVLNPEQKCTSLGDGWVQTSTEGQDPLPDVLRLVKCKKEK